MEITLNLKKENVNTGNMEDVSGFVRIMDFEDPSDQQKMRYDKAKIIWSGQVNGTITLDIPEKISYLFEATASDGTYIRTDPILFDGAVVPLYMCEKPYSPSDTDDTPVTKSQKKKRQRKVEHKED